MVSTMKMIDMMKTINDGLGVLVPWLIGAAVISIGAVAVVFVLKNKGAN